jgi:hypothetical protein
MWPASLFGGINSASNESAITLASLGLPVKRHLEHGLIFSRRIESRCLSPPSVPIKKKFGKHSATL